MILEPKSAGILTLLGAMAVESLAQLSLKIGAVGGPQILTDPYRQWVHSVRALSSSTFWTGLGIVFYVLEIFLYTLVLHWLDVSIAFPMGSLCFVGVALLSKIFLGEAVDRVRWLGICCILIGTVFLAL